LRAARTTGFEGRPLRRGRAAVLEQQDEPLLAPVTSMTVSSIASRSSSMCFIVMSFSENS